MRNTMKIAALIPAYNEEASIASTIEAILSQSRPADIVVIIPNGCSDRTADIAREFPVTVMELPALTHRKSEALNLAWQEFAVDADIVVSIDADTRLSLNAFEDWEKEASEENFGGSTAKFTVQTPGFIGRLQKAEYAGNIQTALNRGWTHVLAGAGTAFSGEALRRIADRPDRVGPWSYDSAVEDYELTYRLREDGLKTYVSPTIRGYTDGMSSVKGLWGQRIKWQAGTISDLLSFGWNKLTMFDWLTQMASLFIVFIRVLAIGLLALALSLGSLSIGWMMIVLPPLFLLVSIRYALRIPHRDRIDMLMASTILSTEFIQVLRAAWILASWWEVVRERVTNRKRDLWAAQYSAEGA